MANQLSGQTGNTPRTYSRHQRHRLFSRVRLGARQFTAFLTQMGSSLSVTNQTVFNDLKIESADRVRQLAGKTQK